MSGEEKSATTQSDSKKVSRNTYHCQHTNFTAWSCYLSFFP